MREFITIVLAFSGISLIYWGLVALFDFFNDEEAGVHFGYRHDEKDTDK